MSIFTDKSRDRLFSNISPNIRGVVTHLEKAEEWVFSASEHPGIYKGISDVIEALSELGDTARWNEPVYDKIIVALSSISFSYSIIALCYLDGRGTPSGKSVAEEVVGRAYANTGAIRGDFYAESLVVKDRVELFIESGVLVNMFSGLIKGG